MKKLLLLPLIFLFGCVPGPATEVNRQGLPSDLVAAGCTLVHVDANWPDRIYLIRCPNGVPKEYLATQSVQTHGKSTIAVGAHFVNL